MTVANGEDRESTSPRHAALQILSGGAANSLVSRLEPRFLRENGLAITGDFGAVGSMRDRILVGEAVDVIILTRALIDELAQSGHVVPETVQDLGEVATGIAIRSGEAAPDISSRAALRQLFSTSELLYVPHTIHSTAGRHVASVIEALGLSSFYGPRLRQFANGQAAMAALAADSDKGAIGCTQVTEILNTDGVDYAGDLPGEYALNTVYTAAVSTSATLADAAHALVKLLADPAEYDARRAAGFA